MAKQKTPAGLGPAGVAMFESVSGLYELEAHEFRVMLEVARTVDELDALHAAVARDGVTVPTANGVKPHPALVESRQLRIALARLVASLRLPSGDEDDPSRPQRRGAARGTYRMNGAR